MNIKKYIAAAAIVFSFVACSEGGKKKGADYTKFSSEMKFEDAKAKNFETVTAKYDAERTAVRESMGEKPDRVALFTKFEEIQARQDDEVKAMLTPEEYAKYQDFVAKNTRKRPRYDAELLAKIKSQAALSDDQMKVVEAANNAFEKSFADAHDVYHGNNELAGEYWQKFDTQRKAAIAKALTPEQNAKFLEVVKDQGFKARE